MNSVCGCGDDCRFEFLVFAGFSALLHQLGDDTGPSSLMAGSHSSTRVAVEVFVKQDQVAPMWVGLEPFEIPEHRSAATLVLEEDVRHAARQFSSYVPKGHHLSRSSRKLNFEVVAKVVMKLLQ